MKTIVVHDGPFQADEVFAVAFLIMYYPGFDMWKAFCDGEKEWPFEIVRTRDEDIIAKADIVCDVGGVYSTHSLRFDHHQLKRSKDVDYVIPRGLHGTWHADAKITPSACGLVLDYLWHYHDSKNTGDLPKWLANRFFKRLVLGIDAIDNGMQQVHEDVKLRYRPCNISNLIAHYNADDAFSDEQESNFRKAIDVALFHLRYIDTGYWRDEYNFEIIKEKAEQQSGDHLVFDKFYPGWLTMLNRAKALHKFKRIIWPQVDGSGKQEYRVQVPPVDLGQGRFTTKYEGLDGSKVDEKDLVFVHEGKFIGATRTMDAAYKL
jgi:uncharacterized UPF0160 family protein